MSLVMSPVMDSVPHWNAQASSPMPFGRYGKNTHAQQVSDMWPVPEVLRAPLWSSVDLRDGNQSLPNPMDRRRKQAMFDLLVRIGFKDIEVGYPSASRADFDFVRHLIENNLIPDDVTIAVFTPAKTELIDRTFEALAGASKAMVHLCNATACLWREAVFGMTTAQVREMVDTSTTHMMRRANAITSTNFRFEYSPETFNVTEPDFALEISDRVASICDASVDRPLVLNLPTTVETDTPNVFANQIDFMNRNLNRRDSIILSVHPHNDRGTAVASAELAMMSGADRVEGTLFGNGERTGNVCLVTLALNLFSQGIDPQLDFTDIDSVRRTVESCNQMEVHPRHPYVGDLVYTAFSGTHQDAISKGMTAVKSLAERTGMSRDSVPWDVPYLPIDPMDVGRTYESIVRVNSQSGKGGIAHVLEHQHGLRLPKSMRREFATVVQAVVDTSGAELEVSELWALFREEYVDKQIPFLFKEALVDRSRTGGLVAITVHLAGANGAEFLVTGESDTVEAAFEEGLRHQGYAAEIDELVVDLSDEVRNIAYARLTVNGLQTMGVGIDEVAENATLKALVVALNKAELSS